MTVEAMAQMCLAMRTIGGDGAVFGGASVPESCVTSTINGLTQPASMRSQCSSVSPGLSDLDRVLLCEEALVRAAQAGHEWAIDELFSRNRARVMRCMYRITRNHEDTEDALQDAMLKAFLNLHLFDRRSKFSTWFTRIAINSSLMVIRKRSKGYHVSLEDPMNDDGAQSHFEIADQAANPEQRYSRRETEAHLSCAISRLPKVLRLVVEARSTDEPSMEETAAALAISVAATKSRLLRARAALRKSLDRRRVMHVERADAATNYY